jgi:hypothetical protein
MMKIFLRCTWWGEKESGPYQGQMLGEEVKKEATEDHVKRERIWKNLLVIPCHFRFWVMWSSIQLSRRLGYFLILLFLCDWPHWAAEFELFHIWGCIKDNMYISLTLRTEKNNVLGTLLLCYLRIGRKLTYSWSM